MRKKRNKNIKKRKEKKFMETHPKTTKEKGK